MGSVLLPQYVVDPIAVEIADADDAPFVTDGRVEIAGIGGEVPLELPSQSSVAAGPVLAPQYIADPIAVEVAGTSEPPFGADDCVEIGGVDRNVLDVERVRPCARIKLQLPLVLPERLLKSG